MKKILFFVCALCVTFSSSYASKQNPKSVFDLLSQSNLPVSTLKSSQAKTYKVTIQMGSSFLNFYYNEGDTPSFDFTPPPGITIQTVYMNGVDVTNQLVNNVYTFSPITENVLLLISTAVDTSTSLQDPELSYKLCGYNQHISIDNLALGQSIELFDVTGELLRNVVCTSEHMTLAVDKPGIYIVRIQKKSYKLVL
jgi:hypothetical protein